MFHARFDYLIWLLFVASELVSITIWRQIYEEKVKRPSFYGKKIAIPTLFLTLARLQQ
jgi:hypothetical protein